MGVSKRKTSKRKTRGKKRSRLSSSARGAYDYAMSNPGNVAGGALGLAGLGVGLGEGYYALRRGLRTSGASPQYLSPTARAIRGVRGYNYRGAGSGLLDRIMPSRIKKRQQKIAEAEAMRQRNAIWGTGRIEYRQQKIAEAEAALEEAVRKAALEDQRSLNYDPEKELAAFTGNSGPQVRPTNQLELGRMDFAQKIANYAAEEEAARKAALEDHRSKSSEYRQLLGSEFARNDAARRSRTANTQGAESLAAGSRTSELRRLAAIETGGEMMYGKRRRRKRKSSFGKKVKKPSAATKRMCKKLKVRLTVKRGKKRVYKSEKVLKKQCKTAMKRKKKK